VEAETVEPALGVFEGSDDVGPGEALVVGGIAVRCEPVPNDFALLVGQELCGVGVVWNEPVGREGNENSEEALLNFVSDGL